jgi:gliding motility-associated-like protein
LVRDINSISLGWDGTFNGNALPSNDYWIKVERKDGHVFTDHFTLMR